MKKPDEKGWIHFCDKRDDPDRLSYWARPLRSGHEKCKVEGYLDGVKLTYWCQFEVQERDANTGMTRAIKPVLSRGSVDSFRGPEAQFRLWPYHQALQPTPFCEI